MVGEGRGSTNIFCRCLSWPFYIYPHLLFSMMNIIMLFSNNIWSMFRTLANPYKRSLLYTYHVIEHVIDHELEAWLYSICYRTSIFLLDWLILPSHFHIMYYYEILWPTRPIRLQKYPKHFKGTITAFPKDKYMTSYYQYSSWFAYMIGARFDTFHIWHGAIKYCWCKTFCPKSNYKA